MRTTHRHFTDSAVSHTCKERERESLTTLKQHLICKLFFVVFSCQNNGVHLELFIFIFEQAEDTPVSPVVAGANVQMAISLADAQLAPTLF